MGVIPIISIIFILDHRPLPQIIRDPNDFTYLGIFAGVALVWLISGSVYNWVVSIPSSRVIQNSWSQFELTRKRENVENRERKYYRKSSSLGFSEFSFLLIIICVIEACIGSSIISFILESQKYDIYSQELARFQQQLSLNPNYKGIRPDTKTPPELDSLSLFLSASIFALTNILFSVSKANRYNQIQKTKRRLNALLNKLNHLDEEIQHCKTEVDKVKKDFEKNKQEYDNLFNKKESGILNEIRLLSNQASVNPPRHTLNSLTNILKYSEELTKIKIDALLNEEQQRSVLSVRDNLLFLASKVAEKEFELKARYIGRDAGLQEKLAKIQEDIKNIKDKPEVKSVREEFHSKGVIREYEMALESIRSVMQEAMEVVKHNAKESKKMHKLLKPLTRMAMRFESRGEAAWSQTDLGSVTEVLGKISEIFANQPRIEINMEKNTVNNSQPTSYTQNINKPRQTGIDQGPNSTGIGTQHNHAPKQNQNLAEAAAEIQKLLEQLSQTYPTETLVAEKALEQIESNQTLRGRVVSVIKAMGVEALMAAINHPVANVLRAGVEALKEPK
ncbi:hypothetical protein [Limnofasciculus baicalensis]|uniref:Uncharacterized protein n=1 Tax=Limnofasciculus baicalensis BBK-W-15 TaxID=2699891 RepID=A0AAE3GYW0_9CYAN|nr:hypothetical protein [Limnofasciculus baicalensis]MCP2731122.1 hypothetical protein [Limnofasciculus baicalensis BBK-W-15]